MSRSYEHVRGERSTSTSLARTPRHRRSPLPLRSRRMRRFVDHIEVSRSDTGRGQGIRRIARCLGRNAYAERRPCSARFRGTRCTASTASRKRSPRRDRHRHRRCTCRDRCGSCHRTAGWSCSQRSRGTRCTRGARDRNGHPWLHNRCPPHKPRTGPMPGRSEVRGVRKRRRSSNASNGRRPKPRPLSRRHSEHRRRRSEMCRCKRMRAPRSSRRWRAGASLRLGHER